MEVTVHTVQIPTIVETIPSVSFESLLDSTHLLVNYANHLIALGILGTRLSVLRSILQSFFKLLYFRVQRRTFQINCLLLWDIIIMMLWYSDIVFSVSITVSDNSWFILKNVWKIINLVLGDLKKLLNMTIINRCDWNYSQQIHLLESKRKNIKLTPQLRTLCSVLSNIRGIEYGTGLRPCDVTDLNLNFYVPLP